MPIWKVNCVQQGSLAQWDEVDFSNNNVSVCSVETNPNHGGAYGGGMIPIQRFRELVTQWRATGQRPAGLDSRIPRDIAETIVDLLDGRRAMATVAATGYEHSKPSELKHRTW